jgi:hypothetical protein
MVAGDGRHYPVLKTEHIPPENISEALFFQEDVNLRM